MVLSMAYVVLSMACVVRVTPVYGMYGARHKHTIYSLAQTAQQHGCLQGAFVLMAGTVPLRIFRQADIFHIPVLLTLEVC